MIRKLAFALSLLGVCFTGFVQALGLGEAEVKSSLNQPLRAEIDLVKIKDLSVDEILPGLATREEFLKAGVDRVYFLSDIRFTVEQNSAGELVVVLTTNKPVREPYLNFLVEVIWPSGRLLREYALLIDPPVFTEQKSQPIQTPVAELPPLGPEVKVTTIDRQSGDVVSISPKSVAQPSSSKIAGGEYGPTGSKDTLWDIAAKARPNRSVSPQQVMLAIQDLNPGAFIDGNINKLKTGQVLRLPTLDQINQRSSYDAINEVIAQNEALRPAKKKALVSASKVKAPKASSSSAASGGDELKLVVSDESVNPTDSANSGDSQTGGASKETAEELSVTLEKLDKANLENTELSGRLEDLEGQLETLQRLLTLKNDQLANLQQQMQSNELERLKAEQEQAVSSEGEKATAANEEMVDAPLETEMATTEADEVAKVEQPETEAAEQAVEEKTVEEPKPESAKPAAPVETKPAQNYFEMITSNPLYMAAAGGVLIVLLLLLLMVSRRNAEKEADFYSEEEADEFSGEAVEDFAEEQELEESDFDEEDESDELLGASDGDVIPQDEEEDAIAEADVYIAYGRLDQAAGILEDAISKDPVRTDYRLKLLEVYKESSDQASFDKQYSELEAIQDTDALEEANKLRSEMVESDLVSIEDMEQELADDIKQQSSPEELEEEVAIAAEAEAIDVEDNSFDLDPVEESQDDEVLDVDLGSDELDVDLDIELETEEPVSSQDEPEFDASMLDDGLDESLLDESLDSGSDEGLLSGGEELMAEADDSLLEQGLEAEGLDEALEDIELDGDLDLESEIELPDDLDLSEDDALPEPESQPEQQVEEAEPSAEDLVVSDDILDEAVDALNEEESFDGDLGDGDDFDFLEGTDEASTKLDLARAYIDMGDVEGARDILEEVQSEGSDEQKSEAAELLASLGD